MIIEDRDGDELEIIRFRDRVEVGTFSEILGRGTVVHLTADQAVEAGNALHEMAAEIRLQEAAC